MPHFTFTLPLLVPLKIGKTVHKDRRIVLNPAIGKVEKKLKKQKIAYEFLTDDNGETVTITNRCECGTCAGS